MKFKVTPSVLEEWQTAERASWEDANSPEEGHVYNVLCRHKTLIDVRSTKEAALLIKSADFIGDATGIDPELVSKRRAIDRIGDKLIEAYGFYYSYPNFKSKTGEVIPDPTEGDAEPEGVTISDIESFYPRKELERMARGAGISPAGKSKRELCIELLKVYPLSMYKWNVGKQ
jgi:hypothetical protein